MVVSYKSKFLRIACPRCKHKTVVYGKSSLSIKCEVCKYLLLRTQGGKAKIRAPVREVLWQ